MQGKTIRCLESQPKTCVETKNDFHPLCCIFMSLFNNMQSFEKMYPMLVAMILIKANNIPVCRIRWLQEIEQNILARYCNY